MTAVVLAGLRADAVIGLIVALALLIYLLVALLRAERF